MKDDIIAQVKETWAEGEVDSLSAFDDWEYIAQVLKDRFIEQVQDKNEKEFREYLEYELGYEKEIVDDYFKEMSDENSKYIL